MKVKKADIGIAVYVLSAFVMMIVPIPNFLLDILLALNMSVAFCILFSKHTATDAEMKIHPKTLKPNAQIKPLNQTLKPDL